MTPKRHGTKGFEKWDVDSSTAGLLPLTPVAQDSMILANGNAHGVLLARVSSFGHQTHMSKLESSPAKTEGSKKSHLAAASEGQDLTAQRENENAASAGGTADHGEVQAGVNQCMNSVATESVGLKQETPPARAHESTHLALPSVETSLQVTSGFDLASLALPQNFADLAAVKTEVASVPVRKPGKQMWFSPHPDQKTWMTMAILKDEIDGEQYILTEKVRVTIPDDWTAKVLVPCLTKQGTIMLWPIRLPGADGKLDSWNQSALQIALNYGGQWIRTNSNRESGAYEAATPIAEYDPPNWPEDMPGLFQRALKGVVIDSTDHPILKRLRGEI